MRNRAGSIILALAVVGVLAAGAFALVAAGPAAEAKPPATTTTTTSPTLWTCAARNANGAKWILGHYDDVNGYYTVSGLPACIDLKPEHAGTRTWTVTWNGAVRTPPTRGLRLVFEPEVHDFENAYLDTVVYGTSGALTPLIAAPEATPFVLVAMPYTGDRWTSINITLTPGS
jgi:hypothetical protein